MRLAAEAGKPFCGKIGQMTPEEIWMRDPQEQCEEELLIYEEIAEYVQGDLEKIDAPAGIITEGAAYLPRLAKQWGIRPEQYMAMTPTKPFQVEHYRLREWVPYVLAECSDKAKAFDNWMERDALFALDVQRQCREAGYVSLINDGSAPVEEMIKDVEKHLGLL